MRVESRMSSTQHSEIPRPVGSSGYKKEAIWADFELGFWHPFGQHGREAASDILRRKQRETERNGWTLWSFQHRTPETLAAWCGELASAQGPILVFCSRGGSAIDPDRPGSLARTSDCTRYRWATGGEWRAMPHLIRVPHPFRPGKRFATAFVVRRVHDASVDFDRPEIEWLRKGKWCADRLPTRPEILIRRGGAIAMPNVGAILELQPPYLAVVGL